MKNLLEKLEEGLNGKEREPARKVVMTTDQLKLWNEFQRLGKLADAANEKALFAKQKVWNKIEGDLELFDSDMSVDDDNPKLVLIKIYKD